MIAELDKKYNHIFVYGYSNLGRNAYNKLKSKYPRQCEGIIVKRYDKKSKKAYEEKGKAIYELNEIKGGEDTIVILALNPIFHCRVREDLTNAGFQNIMIYSEELDEHLNSLMEEIPKLELRFLSVSVGQACNLKCRDCANFAPFALRDNLRYAIDNVKRDLNRTFQYFDEVDTFHIQGGEPFLYTDLKELLYYCRSQFGHIINNIQVATNGTIIPQDEVLVALSETGAIVRISDYAIQTKADELVEVLKQRGIAYRLYRFINKTGEWSASGGIDYVAPETENVADKVNRCAWNTCYTIENATIGRCARSIPARTLQRLIGLWGGGDDYINLNEANSIKNVGKYFMFISPMECCKYCKGSSGEPIPAAIQI